MCSLVLDSNARTWLRRAPQVRTLTSTIMIPCARWRIRTQWCVWLPMERSRRWCLSSRITRSTTLRETWCGACSKGNWKTLQSYSKHRGCNIHSWTGWKIMIEEREMKKTLLGLLRSSLTTVWRKKRYHLCRRLVWSEVTTLCRELSKLRWSSLSQTRLSISITWLMDARMSLWWWRSQATKSILKTEIK